MDYKIASKTIARRIESVLQSVIHPDQSGFVKDRYIGENIRLISNVLEMTKIEKLSGILLSVDFRKAFDTLEWSCIHYALELYNFGDSLRNWVKVFYTEIESVKSAVINNGFATNWFKPTSGVRQGCPLSPYLFILTAELMSTKLGKATRLKAFNCTEMKSRYVNLPMTLTFFVQT